MKTCKECGAELPLNRFSKDKRCDQGVLATCKACRCKTGNLKRNYNKYRNTPKGKAVNALSGIKHRIKKDPVYKNVELRMTNEEFYDWAVPLYETWMRENPGKVPSVDRINEKGHYELGNVRIIERKKNAERAAVTYYSRLGEEQARSSVLAAVRQIPLAAY